jgi:hypothetical protein
MPEQARLTIHGHGGIVVDFVAAYLADLKHAYDSVVVFELVIEGLRRTVRGFPFPVYPFP